MNLTINEDGTITKDGVRYVAEGLPESKSATNDYIHVKDTPPPLITCRQCGKKGYALDEFTSPHTGLCVECTPPELPKQWRHESDPPVRRLIAKGEWFRWNDEDTIEFWNGSPSSMKRHWPVVPAQDKPADCTDAEGVTWTAGEWKKIEGERATYFTHGLDGNIIVVQRIGGGNLGPNEERFNGYRWTAVPVKQEPEVRRWEGVIKFFGHGDHFQTSEVAPLMQDADGTCIDREAIAREEVIREFRDILERTAKGPNRAVEYVAERLSELRGER